MAQRVYRGAIWTNHALERLGQRGLTQELAASAFTNPDKTIPAKNGGTEYQKHIGNSLITLITKKNEKGEWVVLSNWIDPPLPGSIDIKKREYRDRYRKASFWGKLWMEVVNQLIPKRF